MSRLGPVCLLLALLTGCVASKPSKPAEEPNPFALPAGAPRNARVGFIQGYPLRSTSVPLLLIPGTIVREGLQVIARDPQLNPSAVLEITSVRGRLAVARIVRGQPQPKDEVVLPDPELAEQALSLAPLTAALDLGGADAHVASSMAKTQAGIVGLPNVGKSTLFNALTRSRKAEAANYPFCTIEPNVGVVLVPDERMQKLQAIAGTKVVIPATIDIVDIAGLVAGASKGEGKGNDFLSNIRECDAIIHVVRCFDNDDIVHSMGKVDPVRDIGVIETELILADIQSAEQQLDRNQKKVRSQDKDAIANVDLLGRLVKHLNENQPASSLEVSDDERARLKTYNLLSSKKVLFACNVAEGDLADPSKNPHVAAVAAVIGQRHGCEHVVICAQVEAELCDLSPAEATEFLQSLGVTDSGVSSLIRGAYHLLGLATYFTAGEKEVRAWTFRSGMTAPQCAGVIHTDFEKGFVKAEVVSYDDLVKNGSVAAARDAGRYRLEGKSYLFKDGDVALFRFTD